MRRIKFPHVQNLQLVFHAPPVHKHFTTTLISRFRFSAMVQRESTGALSELRATARYSSVVRRAFSLQLNFAAAFIERAHRSRHNWGASDLSRRSFEIDSV